MQMFLVAAAKVTKRNDDDEITAAEVLIAPKAVMAKDSETARRMLLREVPTTVPVEDVLEFVRPF
jgi:hypothetical protein